MTAFLVLTGIGLCGLLLFTGFGVFVYLSHKGKQETSGEAEINKPFLSKREYHA